MEQNKFKYNCFPCDHGTNHLSEKGWTRKQLTTIDLGVGLESVILLTYVCPKCIDTIISEVVYQAIKSRESNRRVNNEK